MRLSSVIDWHARCRASTAPEPSNMVIRTGDAKSQTKSGAPRGFALTESLRRLYSDPSLRRYGYWAAIPPTPMNTDCRKGYRT